MATKRYAEVMERAIDAEIAALINTEGQAPMPKRFAPTGPAPVPPPASRAPGSAYPIPQAGPPTGSASANSAPAAPAPLPPTMPAPSAAPSYGAAPPMPPPATIVAGIDQRVARLMQVREWISEDGDIARLLDSVIGNQVRTSERRQVRINLAFNVLFLLAGWALSIFASPQAMSALLGHHA